MKMAGQYWNPAVTMVDWLSGTDLSDCDKGSLGGLELDVHLWCQVIFMMGLVEPPQLLAQ